MNRIRILLFIFLLPGFTFAQDKLSLEQCRKLALQHNQKVQIARESKSAATSLRKAAFTQFFPDFSFTGDYTHMAKKLNIFSQDGFLPVIPYTAISGGSLDISKLTANDIVINPITHMPVLDANGNPVFQHYAYLPKSAGVIDLTNIYLFNVGVTQPVFTGGKILNLYKTAKYTENIAKANETLESTELISKVDENYYRVISLKEKVRLAEQYKALVSKLIIDLQNYQQEGIIISNDLLKARVRENEADLALLKAQNGLTLSQMALCQSIGLSLDSKPELTDTALEIPLILETKDFVQAGLSQRSELSILQNNVNIAKANVNIMYSRFLPDVGVTGNFLIANPDMYHGFTQDFNNDWNVSLVCHIPLFHWGERFHTLSAARHQKTSSELKLQETKEMITLQVRQAINQYNESLSKIQLTNRSLQQAEENLKVTNDNFAEGTLKATDVLEAQLLWQKAVSENIDARIEALQNKTNLKKVTGDLSRDIQ
ncbi:MAG: TolC family protein [Bacteroidota bacterium]|nr:TolC family protein [Bacteroidota bacterium]